MRATPSQIETPSHVFTLAAFGALFGAFCVWARKSSATFARVHASPTRQRHVGDTDYAPPPELYEAARMHPSPNARSVSTAAALDESGAVAQTYRCRLYRRRAAATPGGSGRFTEVWDTVEEPFPNSKLPAGELVHVSASNSVGESRADMTAYEIAHDALYVGDWTGRGSL